MIYHASILVLLTFEYSIVPVGQAELHMTERRINEDPAVVPCATLDAGRLVHQQLWRQILACDRRG